MILYSLLCVAALIALLLLLRRNQVSLGLPLAYLALLLVIHLPGAIAQIFGGRWIAGYEYTETGIAYSALGAACFVVGVWISRLNMPPAAPPVSSDRRTFAVYCLIVGWTVNYGLGSFSHVPTLGAAIVSGSAIWMLGVLLGLRAAMLSGNLNRIATWSGALAVYPVLMLLLGGFLSYGAVAVANVTSVLAVASRSFARALVGIAVVGVVGLTIFVNYFDHREDIRQSVWGGASMQDRLDHVFGMFSDFHLIDLSSQKTLTSLNERLNQNIFVGLAASRLESRQVDFLNGETVIDSVIYLIPRAVWNDKPETGGSGDLVAKMTGLQLSQDTSWGVGNVLELYINFGLPGVVIGFTLLGWAIGMLDLRAAIAERRGDLRTVIMYFLPAVGLIQPGGSIMEMTGATAAAVAAAYVWRWGWDTWLQMRPGGRPSDMTLAMERMRRPRAGPAI